VALVPDPGCRQALQHRVSSRYPSADRRRGPARHQGKGISGTPPRRQRPAVLQYLVRHRDQQLQVMATAWACYVLSRTVLLVNGREISSCGSWRQMPSCMVCYPGTHAKASAFVMKHESVTVIVLSYLYGSHIAPNPARSASILHTPYAMGLGLVLLTQRRNERDPFPLPASAGRPTSCATSTPVSGCSNPFRCLINSNISLISSGVGGCQSSANGLSVSGLIMTNPLAKQPQQSPRLTIFTNEQSGRPPHPLGVLQPRGRAWERARD